MLETLINTYVLNGFGVMEMTPQGGQKEAFGYDIFDQISLIVENHQISHIPLCAVFARGGMSQTPRTAADLAMSEHGGVKGSYISCCAVLCVLQPAVCVVHCFVTVYVASGAMFTVYDILVDGRRPPDVVPAS